MSYSVNSRRLPASTRANREADYLGMANMLGISGQVHNDELYTKCPMHVDRSPSFGLNVRTGLWICHRGCGSGDFTKLVMKVNNVSVREASAWIASNGRKVTVEVVRDRLAKLLKPSENIAVEDRWWEPYYRSLPEGVMCNWFLARGFSWSAILEWGIRWDDREQCVVIPVMSRERELAGIIQRHLRSGKPKYWNNPELPKSRLLYGHHLQQVQGMILVTEGPLDAVWMNQLGYPAVAILGAELSSYQADLLMPYTEVVLSLDSDEAGTKGKNKAAGIGTLFKAGFLPSQITCLTLPEGRKDVQECTKEEIDEAMFNRRNVAPWQA